MSRTASSEVDLRARLPDGGMYTLQTQALALVRP